MKFIVTYDIGGRRHAVKFESESKASAERAVRGMYPRLGYDDIMIISVREAD